MHTTVAAYFMAIFARTPARQRLAGHVYLASVAVVGGLFAALVILASFTGAPDTVEWPQGKPYNSETVN